MAANDFNSNLTTRQLNIDVFGQMADYCQAKVDRCKVALEAVDKSDKETIINLLACLHDAVSSLRIWQRMARHE